jgi:hypothetical protein
MDWNGNSLGSIFLSYKFSWELGVGSWAAFSERSRTKQSEKRTNRGSIDNLVCDLVISKSSPNSQLPTLLPNSQPNPPISAADAPDLPELAGYGSRFAACDRSNLLTAGI